MPVPFCILALFVVSNPHFGDSSPFLSATLQDLDAHKNRIELSYLPDGNFILISFEMGGESQLKVVKYKKDNGEMIEDVFGKQREYFRFTYPSAISPNGRYLVRDVVYDRLDPIGVWDLETKKRLFFLDSQGVRLAFSSDGKKLASSDDKGEVSLYDFETSLKYERDSLLNKWEPYKRLKSKTDFFVEVKFSADSRSLYTYVGWMNANELEAYQLDEWDFRKDPPQKIRQIKLPIKRAEITFTKNGRGIYLYNDRSIALLDLTQMDEEGRPKLVWHHKNESSYTNYTKLKLSPNGKYLAYSKFGSVERQRFELLDAETGKVLKVLSLPDPSATFFEIAFSPDSKRLLGVTSGASIEGTKIRPTLLHFWNLDSLDR